MGRSIMTYGESAVHFAHNIEDDFEGFEFSDMMEYIADQIAEKYTSFENVIQENKWVGREGRIILENQLIQVAITEYCGLAAVSFIIDPAAEEYNYTALAQRLIPYIETYTTKLLKKSGYGVLSRIGTFSNGVGVYKKS
jgi:hypothetical protein